MRDCCCIARSSEEVDESYACLRPRFGFGNVKGSLIAAFLRSLMSLADMPSAA